MSVELDPKKFQRSRQKMRMTQFRLAELAGTSDRYIRAIESGEKTNPSAKLLFRAGKALGVSVEELMAPKEGEERPL